MITLRAAATAHGRSPERHLWALTTDSTGTPDGRTAFLVERGIAPPAGWPLYILKPGATCPLEPSITVGSEMDYLGDGDIVGITPEGTGVQALWRVDARPNTILLTEQCDNYCLMCSQPPKARDDSWLLRRATELITMLPTDTRGFMITGGEPTVFGQEFLDFVGHCAAQLPDAAIHVLSNGRRFADETFAAAYAGAAGPGVMTGIPIYSAEPDLHDHVVQADGAFNETIRGILNLATAGARVEIRVVVHKIMAPELVRIGSFVARNLPFVEQVVLMGLELTGLARTNLDVLWIDPWDYRHELEEATDLLDAAGIPVMIYNHPLCLLTPRARRHAVQSISDWKNEYIDECDRCSERAVCGGFFASASLRRSAHVRALPHP